MNRNNNLLTIKTLLLSLFLTLALTLLSGIGTFTVKAENWNESTFLPTRSGTFVLQKDITLKSTWANDVGVLGASYYFDLNGHNIKMTGIGPVMDIKNTSVTITNSKTTGGIISGGNNTTPGKAGGISCIGTDLVMSNVTIKDNSSVSYGGILCSEASTMELENVKCINNKCSGFGGGMCIIGGCVSAENCEFTGNKAAYGGGFSIGQGSAQLHNAIIKNNTADNYGGCFYYGGKLSVGGKIVCNDNNSSGGGKNMVIKGGKVIAFNDKLSEGSFISLAKIDHFYRPASFDDITDETYETLHGTEMHYITADHSLMPDNINFRLSNGRLVAREGYCVTFVYDCPAYPYEYEFHFFNDGTELTEVPSPTADGYTFGAWYETKKYEKTWNHENPGEEAEETEVEPPYGSLEWFIRWLYRLWEQLFGYSPYRTTKPRFSLFGVGTVVQEKYKVIVDKNISFYAKWVDNTTLLETMASEGVRLSEEDLAALNEKRKIELTVKDSIEDTIALPAQPDFDAVESLKKLDPDTYGSVVASNPDILKKPGTPGDESGSGSASSGSGKGSGSGTDTEEGTGTGAGEGEGTSSSAGTSSEEEETFNASTFGADAVTEIVPETDASLDVETIIEGGTATLGGLDEDSILKALGDASAEGGAGSADGSDAAKATELSIDAAAGSEDVDTVVTPSDALSTILDVMESGENDLEAVSFNLSGGKLIIDKTALKAINDQADGNEVSMHIEIHNTDGDSSEKMLAIALMRPLSSYDIYIEAGGKRITDFNGGLIEVVLDVTVENEEDANFYHVNHIDDLGNADVRRTWVLDGKLHFETPTLSTYIVVFDSETANATTEVLANGTSKRIIPYLILNKTIRVGKSFALNLTNIKDDAVIGAVSSNEKIAKINKNGVIVGVAKGKALIEYTVRQNDGVYKILLNIKVEKNANYQFNLKNDVLRNTDGELPLANVYKRVVIGKPYKIKLKGLDKTALVTLQSEDPSIAVITKKGKIKAVKSGVTSINVTVTQGSFMYGYRIVVRIPGGDGKAVFKEWFR